MGEKTSISWSDSTANPILARTTEPIVAPGREMIPAGKLGFHCVKVSPECLACYAETFNERGLPARGTGLPFRRDSQEKIEIVLDEVALAKVLSWRRPRKIFWCSMTDLFGRFVPSWMIQSVLDTAVEAGEKRGHVSQILTKRPHRMVAELRVWTARHGRKLPACVWPGFSAGDRSLFDARWPIMRALGVKELVEGPLWCSYEPAIGPLVKPGPGETAFWMLAALNGLAWVVWGGESGNQARPFDLQWGRDVNEYLGAAAGIQVWSKQVGRRPVDSASLRWMHHELGTEAFRLYADHGSGDQVAAVWGDGSWYVVERDGAGGENDRAPTIEEAKAAAYAAALRAGLHAVKLKTKKGDDPAEWPTGLLLQEFPFDLAATAA